MVIYFLLMVVDVSFDGRLMIVSCDGSLMIVSFDGSVFSFDQKFPMVAAVAQLPWCDAGWKSSICLTPEANNSLLFLFLI